MVDDQETYKRAQEAFEELELMDKAVFLAKEAANTVVHGVEEAARTLESFLHSVQNSKDDEESDAPEEGQEEDDEE